MDSVGLDGRSLDEVEAEMPPAGCEAAAETLLVDGIAEVAPGGNEGVEDDEAVVVSTGDSTGCRLVVLIL
jgi:hypothetical protein